MPSGTFTREWISSKAQMSFRGAIPPDPNKFYVALADTNALTRASSKADFIAAELLPINGYSRKQFLYSADGTYNTTNERHEMPDITVEFTASGGSLQFQTAFLIANAHATASRSFAATDVNAATDTIAIANHGLSNGDEVLFTPDPTATLPSGIVAGTLYKVANATANDFKLATLTEVPIDITNAGSGTLYCRYASGMVVALTIESSPIQVLDGTTHSYRIPLVELNTANASGI